MFNTILFDLDGTLNNLNMEFFFQRYLSALVPYFQDFVPAGVFTKELMRCTSAMMGNTDPGLTALEVFWRCFPAAVGSERAVLEPAFLRFYGQAFPGLRPDNAVNAAARPLLQTALEKRYTVVIATNPIFPEIAIRERMVWTGCDDIPFTYVTCGEKMHFCKPNPAFFQELLVKIDRQPADCLMVGNDLEEDMIAQSLGLTAALVTDNLIDRGQAVVKPDWRGTLHELADVFAAGREQDILTPSSPPRSGS